MMAFSRLETPRTLILHASRLLDCGVFLALASGLTLPAATLTVAKTGGAYTTIQAGINAAQAGDTVSVAAGVYNELVKVNKAITVSGAAGAVVDGTGLSTAGEGLVVLSASNTTFRGFEVRNFATTSASHVPVGIRIASGISHITVQDNLVHHITTSESSDACNAHGIAVYGESATANTDINILGNEIHSCKLGQSETLVINGNVDGWIVADNYIHDNDNIGIDAIGFEGTGPAGFDQARNGKIINNIVKNISSAANKTYGTNEHSADGIYVDGGTKIIIEGNQVDACDIGIELASEHAGKNTSDITVRGNFVSRSYQANILMGGYDAKRGNAVNIAVLNNTTYKGGSGDGAGEICLQYHCSTITIANNILWANAGQAYLQQSGTGNSGVSVSHNLYYGASAASPGQWSDASPRFTDPKLINTYLNMHLQASSPAINAGKDLGPQAGTLDIDGTARVQGGLIDLGADEYSNSSVTFRITASAGSGGTISPSGAVSVAQGTSQTFVITPASGYQIASVTVDGTNLGAVSTYTFDQVQAAHTITAAFKAGAQETNIAPSGVAYVWSRNTTATSNAHRVAKAGLNDGNLAANVSVYANGDIAKGWEAAGIIFPTARTISAVSFINGTITNGDGYLEAGLRLEISPDGTTWSAATPAGWSLDKAYPYSAAAAGQTYTFRGPTLIGVKGVRLCGQVVVIPNSYFWRLKEVQVLGR